MINNGDENAKNLLVEKYRQFSWSLAKRLFKEFPTCGLSVEDMMAMAFADITIALKTFEFSLPSFYGYWCTIASNDIRRMIRSLIHESYLKGNVVFLDTPVYEEESTLHEYVGRDEVATEQNMLRDMFLTIVNNPKNEFTVNQRIVIIEFLDGYDFHEIAELHGWSRSKTYYTYKEAIRKIRKAMKEPK